MSYKNKRLAYPENNAENNNFYVPCCSTKTLLVTLTSLTCDFSFCNLLIISYLHHIQSCIIIFVVGIS